MSGRLKKPPRRCWFCKIRNPRQLFEGKNDVHICDQCVALFHDLRVDAPDAPPQGSYEDGWRAAIVQAKAVIYPQLFMGASRSAQPATAINDTLSFIMQRISALKHSPADAASTALLPPLPLPSRSRNPKACSHHFIEPKDPLGFVCTTCKAIVYPARKFSKSSHSKRRKA